MARETLWGFVWLMGPVLCGSAPWGVQSTRLTGIGGTEEYPLTTYPAISATGDVYIPVLESGSIAIRRVDSTGHQIFEIAIAGAVALNTLLLGPDGDIYVAGTATDGLMTTPGAYMKRPAGIGVPTPFQCGFSGLDGHVLFCSYVNAAVHSQGTINGATAVDSAGNLYSAVASAEACPERNIPYACVEKVSPTSGLVYQTSLESLKIYSVTSVSVDSAGTCYIAGQVDGSFVLAKVDAQGNLVASVTGNPNEVAFARLDPTDRPQLLVSFAANFESARVRRYSSDLSTILFETSLEGAGAYDMEIDASGTTTLIGITSSIAPQIHPTAACDLSSAQNVGWLHPVSGLALARLDASGQLAQSTFLPLTPTTGIAFVSAQQGGGAILVWEDADEDWEVVTLGPAPEVQLGCLGNTASLQIGPLAPEELISLFGQRLGPDSPVAAHPDKRLRYLYGLGGTEVTFDGLPATIYYASSSEVRVVTPRALEGRSATHICVVVARVQTNCIDAPVQPAAPGIFPAAGSLPYTQYYEQYYAAALNQDGTVNSQDNPAAIGSTVSIFATGTGPLSPALPNGAVIPQPAISQTLSLALWVITGTDKNTNSYTYGFVNIFYAGPAPMGIEGLTQINFQAGSGPLVLVLNSDALPVVPSFGWSTTIPVLVWTK